MTRKHKLFPSFLLSKTQYRKKQAKDSKWNPQKLNQQ